VAGPLTRTLRLSGGNPASLLLRLALARAAASAASAIDGGVPPGADARAAATAAKAVGATVVLGDRPIEITLRRAWEGTTWRERAAVVRLLGSDAPPTIATPPSSPSTVAAVEALAADPASLAALAASLTSAAPSLGAALLDERDEWIAWSLARSRAVSGADAVVGVFGAGHVRGVAWQLLTRQGDGRPRFKELAGVGEGSARALAQRLGVEFVVGTAVAAAAAAWWSLG
jgi:pheromone shutdown protein TraB